MQLDWQRTLAGGSGVSAPGSSQVLTLRPGDRILLDSMTPPTTACWATVGFEARYMPRPFAVTGVAYSSQRGVYQPGGVGRVSGGGGRGSAGGGVGTESNTTVRVASLAGGSGAGGGTRVHTGSATFTITTVAQYDVNLWLVRQAPGKPDESQHQVLRVGRDDVAFAFPPADAATTKGQVSVQVTGSVAVTTGANGPQLMFTTNRRVASARANESPRDCGHAGAESDGDQTTRSGGGTVV